MSAEERAELLAIVARQIAAHSLTDEQRADTIRAAAINIAQAAYELGRAAGLTEARSVLEQQDVTRERLLAELARLF